MITNRNEIMITKQNVYENIDNFLKKEKIRFTVQNYSSGDFYELLLGSINGFIQVEISEEETDNSVYFQFFSNVNYDGNSLYNSNISAEDENFSLDGEIFELVNAVKKMNVVVAKIESKISQIKEICEDNEMDFENFIEIVYDFNV